MCIRDSNDLFALQDKPLLLSGLVVVYAVLLIMYFELSNGVLRYSMLDTSIRTNEVYVMNPQKIVGKYHRSLIINPIIAVGLATVVLSANTILPFFVGIFSKDTALRMEESVELISVYGVALGTFFVFCVVGGPGEGISTLAAMMLESGGDATGFIHASHICKRADTNRQVMFSALAHPPRAHPFAFVQWLRA